MTPTNKDKDAVLRAAITGLPRPDPAAGQAAWKNYAEALSNRIAQAFADVLRNRFSHILPSADGAGHESRARGAKGMKRLDVNYSTPAHGLGLGVSIKTINKRDPKQGHYCKNFSRIDGELRAEATDYHRRQPYAVLVAVLFLPFDACQDGRGSSPSSFGSAVKHFFPRNHREKPTDDADGFERLFVGLYSSDGATTFIDVNSRPPRQGPPRPTDALSFPDLIDALVEEYENRNHSKFLFDDGQP
ncbi:MAG: hypothetical protein K8T90_15780 [Planctomycetes bacterium]|nr:hypothetical protein [Planctomycetota bacterium]